MGREIPDKKAIPVLYERSSDVNEEREEDKRSCWAATWGVRNRLTKRLPTSGSHGPGGRASEQSSLDGTQLSLAPEVGLQALPWGSLGPAARRHLGPAGYLAR